MLASALRDARLTSHWRHPRLAAAICAHTSRQFWPRLSTALGSLPASAAFFSAASGTSAAVATPNALHAGSTARELADLLLRHAKRSETQEATSALATVAPLFSSYTGHIRAGDIAKTLHALSGFSSDAPGAAVLVSAMPRHISACRDMFTARDVSMVLYGLRKLGNDRACPVLQAMAPHIVRCRELDAQGVGNALYGLQGCSSERPEVLSVLWALAPHIVSCGENLSPQAIGNALYGLKGCSSHRPEVLSVLRALAPHFDRCKESFTPQNVSNALFGLQGCSSKPPEVRAVLKALALQIQRCKESLSAQGVGNALYGLKSCTSEEPEARDVLRALVPRIAACAETLRPQHVGNALYGLRGCSSNTREVRSVLWALAPHIERCRTFDAQAVGTSLYGLRYCSSHHPAVARVLRALAPLIARSTDALSAQHVSNALVGLQTCSSNNREVLSVLKALAPHIERCKELDAQGIGNALYGLQGCSSAHQEVAAVLSALATLIPRCSELDSQGIGNALYGLQGCSSDHPEVLAILKSFVPHVTRCTELDAQAVGNSLLGLQGCSSEQDDVRALLGALAPHVERCAASGSLRSQHIGNAMYGLQGCSTDHPEVAAVVTALMPAVEKLALHLSQSQAIAAVPTVGLVAVTQGCAAMLLRAADDRAVAGAGLFASKVELLYDACARELDSRAVRVDVSHSESHFRARTAALFSEPSSAVSVHPTGRYLHGFEADIVLTVTPLTEGAGAPLAPVTVNLEVDGPSHHSLKGRRFSSVRDAHLRSKGVTVLRWDLMAADGHSGPAFDEWLRRELRGLRVNIPEGC